MRKLVTILIVSSISATGMLAVTAAQDADPKYSISDVMKKCMKGGLCKTVAGGEASDAEKSELLEMFTALAQNQPPQGDADSWNTKTAALVGAAQLAVDGDAGASAALRKAANCKACHSAHKGE